MRIILIILLTLLGYSASAQQEVELCSYYSKTFNYWSQSNVNGGGWLWLLNNDTISINNQVTITWRDTGYYTIKVFYKNDCGKVKQEYFVHVVDCVGSAIFFPNAFTPNGDGINDTWSPIPRKITEIRWMVFNRWGEKVYETNKIGDKWDGKYKGAIQGTFNFVYICWWKGIDGKTGFNKGNLIQIR
jgi:gliding motility-associated-like protein